jgi:DNA-binding NarL/FixJ family response regulator
LASRVAQLAEYVEVAHRIGGSGAAIALVRKRGGKQFDPRLTALICSHADEIFNGLDSVQTWNAVIEAEPALAVVLSDEQFDSSLLAATISTFARILGAADAYQAMREPRPYRAARSADEAAEALRVEVRAGRLDGDAVEAVLGAAGHRARRRREGPAGLTAREVEVLRLLAGGLSTKQIARRLTISPKTAGNHIEHIYSKIDATNRATASLFAIQHGLLPDDELSPAPSS